MLSQPGEMPEQSAAPATPRRARTGLWLHIAAGAALIVVMAVAALYVTIV
ncbi:MAG TPA: hypothetical protein VJ890_24385 [Vineibacter sp.]|nr:hypothetical protein [Vineibacter sp.]